jgi:hypothetical protein
VLNTALISIRVGTSRIQRAALNWRLTALPGVLVASLACTGSPGLEPTVPGEPSLIAACIRDTACWIKPYPRVSNCTSYYMTTVNQVGMRPVYDKIYHCVLAARSCDEVAKCHGQGQSCDSSYRASCNADQATYCDLQDKVTYSWDCAASGLICAVDRAQAHGASCSGGSPAQPTLVTTVDCAEGVCDQTTVSCSADDFDRCSGSRLETCLDGYWVRYDCATLGLGACVTQTETWGEWARCNTY